MSIRNKVLAAVVLMCAVCAGSAAPRYSPRNGHSHNDYKNAVPFWPPYERHFGSIEADIWAVDGGLYVAHDEQDIDRAKTLEAMYIEPIVQLFRRNGGTAWEGGKASFQLMIDIKTPTEPALSRLADMLGRFPEVFDPGMNKSAVRIVITGNAPEPSDFHKYPGFLYFDGVAGRKYDRKALARIALYSGDFKKFSSWDGKGVISADDRTRLRQAVDSAHSMKKRIRFWNAPDDRNAWEALMGLGVDLINTDHVPELAEFLSRQ